MYNEYFGFKKAPFSIAPDPQYLFMTQQHREALAHLVYGLNSDGGCILLTGEVGTGKTTICRCLLEQIPEHAHIALLLNPKVTVIELLETICDEFKIAYPDGDNTIKVYIDLINDHLLASYARGEKSVLIIDEAQNLDPAVLEQLRLLTNLETNQHKLLQIVLLGQPELIEILSREDMRQLAQRITARYHLSALSQEEIKAYITHRLAVAGQNARLFPDDVIRRIYQISKGIPRLINVISDRALLGAYVQNKPNVDMVTVKQAAKEIFGELKNQPHEYRGTDNSRWILPAIAILSTVLIGIVFYFSSTQGEGFEEGASASMSVAPAPPPETPAISQAASPVAVIEPPVAEEPMDVVIEDPADTASRTEQMDATKEPEKVIAQYITRNIDNRADAYRSVFGRWGVDYNMTRDGNACKHASRFQLGCLHRTGSIEDLLGYDRPAILRLFDDTGNSIYAALIARDGDDITLITSDEQIRSNIDDLQSHWYGDFTILWKQPPFYEDSIRKGDDGAIVQWVDQQLARVFDTERLNISDTYDARMQQQVKRFQLDNGIYPDGIAGPQTLIHLNTAIGTETPKLTDTTQGAS